MILYYRKGSDMMEKMTRPMPKTVRLLMKVKLFLRLFNLSYILYGIHVAYGSRSRPVPDSYDLFVVKPNRC